MQVIFLIHTKASYKQSICSFVATTLLFSEGYQANKDYRNSLSKLISPKFFYTYKLQKSGEIDVEQI